MSTHDKATPVTKRWAVPGVAALIGLAYLVAGVVGDDLGFGVFGLALMLGIGSSSSLPRDGARPRQGCAIARTSG